MPIIKKDEIRVRGDFRLEKKGFSARETAPAEASRSIASGAGLLSASQITAAAPPPAETLDRQEARGYIDSLKQKAQQEVEKILAQAQKQAQQEYEQAKRRGYEEGQKKAAGEARDKINQALSTLTEAITAKKKIIRSSEPDILKLAVKIAEQVIKSEVSINKDVVMNIVAEAVSKITDREQVVIRVNPANVDQIKGQKSRLLALIDGVKNLTIQEDNQVDPGGCIVETTLGFVDARIATKLTAIEDALKRVGEEDEDSQG